MKPLPPYEVPRETTTGIVAVDSDIASLIGPM